MNAPNSRPTILVAEDDDEQMEVLVHLMLDQLKKVLDEESTSESRHKRLNDIQIAKVSNISSMKKAVEASESLIFAVMDCNMPDKKGGAANDQLVKTNHRITGQHNGIDTVISQHPGIPITMISSLNRFRNLLTRYYKSKHNLDINFISKSDKTMLQRNVGYYIRQYLRLTD